jgi:hypothetical protein
VKTRNLKKLSMLFILFIGFNASSFAVVPTTDVYAMGQDTTTTTQYAGQITTYLGQIGSTMNAAQQVSSLKGLAAVQGAGSQLCALCNKSDLASLSQYSTDINSDLCSQFSNALSNITGAKQSITTLQGIMSTFATNPKAAVLALQQAAIATQTATQNTMAQMQMLQAQAQQRELAKEKMEQTSTADALGNGFHSGL